MKTVFHESIPQVFHERYRAQFEEWGREYRRRGRRQAIVFDVLPGQTPLLDVAGRLAWSGAWLTADLESYRGERVMMIRPASDFDQNLIALHCWNLNRSILT